MENRLLVTQYSARPAGKLQAKKVNIAGIRTSMVRCWGWAVVMEVFI